MSHPDRLSRDAELAVRIRQGDVLAFRQLFDLYYTPLRRYATMLLGGRDAGEDIVQGLFVHLWAERARWSVRGNVRSYLYQSVHRRVMSEWRASRVRRRHVEQELGQAPADDGSAPETWPDRLAEGAELREAYARAVATLPPRVHEAFDLRYQHHLSSHEIGEIMGISHRTVEHHIANGLLRIREQLAPYLSVALLLSLR